MSSLALHCKHYCIHIHNDYDVAAAQCHAYKSRKEVPSPSGLRIHRCVALHGVPCGVGLCCMHRHHPFIGCSCLVYFQHSFIRSVKCPIPSELGSQTTVGLASTQEGDHRGTQGNECFFAAARCANMYTPACCSCAHCCTTRRPTHAYAHTYTRATVTVTEACY